MVMVVSDDSDSSGDGHNDVDGDCDDNEVRNPVDATAAASGEDDEVIVMIAIRVMTKNRTRKRNRHCRMFGTAKAMLVFTVSFWQILHWLKIVQIRSLKQINTRQGKISFSVPHCEHPSSNFHCSPTIQMTHLPTHPGKCQGLVAFVPFHISIPNTQKSIQSTSE